MKVQVTTPSDREIRTARRQLHRKALVIVAVAKVSCARSAHAANAPVGARKKKTTADAARVTRCFIPTPVKASSG